MVFDNELRNKVIKKYLDNNEEVDKIYKFLLSSIDRIYNSENLNAPAIFSSKIFFGDYESWDPSLHSRAVAAIYQLLIDVAELPIWVSWGDVEISGETLRVIYVFSNASKVEGIKGRVLVCQFSDDDRVVELEYGGKKVEISTLKGASSLYYVIHEEYSKNSINETLEKAKAEFDKIYDEIGKLIKKLKISEVEEAEEERERIKELLELPELDEELGGVDFEEELF